jgi:capsular exopolysaccharide synthesis family protein
MELIRKISREKDGGNNNSISIQKLMPYWPLFATLVVVMLAGGWLYLQMATPKYESHARILIKDEKKGSEESEELQALDLLTPKKSSDNEIEVIKSNTLINKVVDELDLCAPVYQKESFRDKLAYTTSPIIVIPDSTHTLELVKKAPFKFSDDQVVIGKDSYPLNEWVHTPYGRLRFANNPHYIKNTSEGEFYFSVVDPKKVVNNISSALNVESANKLSSIIDLSITDEVPQRGQDILNTLIDVYNQSLVTEKNVLAANTIKFLDQRLATVQQQLQDIERKQEQYKSGKGAIDISTQGKTLLENVSVNDQKTSEINMQLSVLNQIDNYVRSKDMSKAIVPTTAGIEDPGLTGMVKNIYELQLEVESLKKTTGENNPMVIADEEKIEKIRPQILENIQNQRQALAATKRDLSNTNGAYSSTLSAMPETEKTLIDISREQTIENGLYTFLLQKKEETALSFVSNDPGSKIVDRAESSDLPVSPKAKLVYLMALILAFVIGISIVLTKESMSRTVMFQKDIEELTQLPVIGEITVDKSKKNIVIGNSERTLIAEQFRRLRTTLHYLDIGNDKKRIMVTSGISGEGKSFVASNLALSLALTGKRVILLDFDLNKPTLSAKLNIHMEKGITEYLKGEATLSEILIPTSINNNLFFIAPGQLPDSPSELLTNGVTGDLLDELSQMFDHIVIDMAPVGPVSDAYIVSPYCDITLYIVRHAYTPKTFLERLDINNKLNKLNNAAIVFNGVSQRGYGQAYGYGYGYVYGNEGYKKRLSIG